jgi:anaerobic selenocysteine-containing dehydrogenase
MIVIGGSSMHKGDGSWTGARAIGCLPALTGNVGIAGGGFGPRHGSAAHGQGLTSITAEERRPDGAWIPSQMPAVTEAMLDGRLRVMLLLGTNMLSSYADAGQVAEGLARQDLVVAYDLFMNDTARRCADVVLPATAWLEELGCKSTNTHLYLMPKVLDAPGQARPVVWVLRELARRLEVDDFFPWTEESGPLDAILDHPATNHATVASISAEGGIHALNVSPIGHPDLKFPTPSGKVELLSELAGTLGLPALPVHEASGTSRYPLVLSYGRTLTHFHAFYDHGRALPSLAQADPEPALWISPADATARGVSDGGPIRIVNDRGAMTARAHVTERVPAGTVWMRDGWLGINDLSGGAPAIPDAAVQALQPLGFSGGQATFDARVEVEAV